MYQLNSSSQFHCHHFLLLDPIPIYSFRVYSRSSMAFSKLSISLEKHKKNQERFSILMQNAATPEQTNGTNVRSEIGDFHWVFHFKFYKRDQCSISHFWARVVRSQGKRYLNQISIKLKLKPLTRDIYLLFCVSVSNSKSVTAAKFFQFVMEIYWEICWLTIFFPSTVNLNHTEPLHSPSPL